MVELYKLHLKKWSQLKLLKNNEKLNLQLKIIGFHVFQVDNLQ